MDFGGGAAASCLTRLQLGWAFGEPPRAWAMSNECTLRESSESEVRTFDFQAPDLYRRHGYDVYATLPGNSRGHIDTIFERCSEMATGSPNSAMNRTVWPVTRLAGLLLTRDSNGSAQGARPSRPAGYAELTVTEGS